MLKINKKYVEIIFVYFDWVDIVINPHMGLISEVINLCGCWIGVPICCQIRKKTYAMIVITFALIVLMVLYSDRTN